MRSIKERSRGILGESNPGSLFASRQRYSEPSKNSYSGSHTSSMDDRYRESHEAGLGKRKYDSQNDDYDTQYSKRATSDQRRYTQNFNASSGMAGHYNTSEKSANSTSYSQASRMSSEYSRDGFRSLNAPGYSERDFQGFDATGNTAQDVEADNSGEYSHYLEGYNSGYKSQNFEADNSGENSHYLEGYNSGYKSQNFEADNSGENSHYLEGYNSGYKSQNFEADNSGNNSHYFEADNSGYSASNFGAFDPGYSSSNFEGYNSGYNSKNYKAYNSGYSASNFGAFNPDNSSSNFEAFDPGYSSSNFEGYNSGYNSKNYKAYNLGYSSSNFRAFIPPSYGLHGFHPMLPQVGNKSQRSKDSKKKKPAKYRSSKTKSGRVTGDSKFPKKKSAKMRKKSLSNAQGNTTQVSRVTFGGNRGDTKVVATKMAIVKNHSGSNERSMSCEECLEALQTEQDPDMKKLRNLAHTVLSMGQARQDIKFINGCRILALSLHFETGIIQDDPKNVCYCSVIVDDIELAFKRGYNIKKARRNACSSAFNKIRNLDLEVVAMKKAVDNRLPCSNVLPSGQRKRHKTQTSTSLDHLRGEHENDAEWNLRSQFLEANMESLSSERLDSLSRCFVNITLYGCSYPESVMSEVERASAQITVDGLLNNEDVEETETKDELDNINTGNNSNAASTIKKADRHENAALSLYKYSEQDDLPYLCIFNVKDNSKRKEKFMTLEECKAGATKTNCPHIRKLRRLAYEVMSLGVRSIRPDNKLKLAASRIPVKINFLYETAPNVGRNSVCCHMFVDNINVASHTGQMNTSKKVACKEAMRLMKIRKIEVFRGSQKNLCSLNNLKLDEFLKLQKKNNLLSSNEKQCQVETHGVEMSTEQTQIKVETSETVPVSELDQSSEISRNMTPDVNKLSCSDSHHQNLLSAVNDVQNFNGTNIFSENNIDDKSQIEPSDEQQYNSTNDEENSQSESASAEHSTQSPHPPNMHREFRNKFVKQHLSIEEYFAAAENETNPILKKIRRLAFYLLNSDNRILYYRQRLIVCSRHVPTRIDFKSESKDGIFVFRVLIDGVEIASESNSNSVVADSKACQKALKVIMMPELEIVECDNKMALKASPVAKGETLRLLKFNLSSL